MKRLDNLDWLPIQCAERDLTRGSKQVVLIYEPEYEGQCFLEYTTSNPDYVLANVDKFREGTEFALVVNG